MEDELSTHEKIVLKALRAGGCVSLETSMTPAALIAKCAAEGFNDAAAIELATVGLIDKDMVEYEMNDRLETSNLWLLGELNG